MASCKAQPDLYPSLCFVIIQANPSGVTVTADRGSADSGSRPLQQQQQAEGSSRILLPSAADEATHVLVAQLQQEKELLARQLECVEQECERLQVRCRRHFPVESLSPCASSFTPLTTSAPSLTPCT